MKIRKFFGRKVGKGKVALPLWTVGIAAMAIAAVAGQAVGPVLTGSVSGSVNLVIEQTVRLGGPGTITNSGGAADDFAATINDEGTGFTVAIETDVGQNQSVTWSLLNESGQTANAMLQLNVPAGIDVEMNSAGSATEAQLSPNTWLLTIPAGGSPSMTMEIESKDTAMPGFYTITGTLVQISG